MLISTNNPHKIILKTEELNLLLVSVSSHIFSLESMWYKTNEDQYFQELQKVRELKNNLILVKRNLVVSE